MTPFDELWQDLQVGGMPFTSQRIDAEHPLDLFASVGQDLAPGLVLLCDVEPSSTIGLDAVEVTVNARSDGRWALGFWLNRPDLRGVFTELCHDLVQSSREVGTAEAPAFMLARIERWRRLLEPDRGLLSVSEIRGLIAELVVFQHTLALWRPDEVVVGWVGPLEAPQDFVLPGIRIEVKANIPSSRTVRITSLEQLDVDEPMLLSVVTLASSVERSDAVTLPGVIASTTALVGARGTMSDVAIFDRRLEAARYRLDPVYEKLWFKVQEVQFFTVADGFPRIRRRDVPAGVQGGTYDILLSTVTASRTTLGR